MNARKKAKHRLLSRSVLLHNASFDFFLQLSDEEIVAAGYTGYLHCLATIVQLNLTEFNYKSQWPEISHAVFVAHAAALSFLEIKSRVFFFARTKNAEAFFAKNPAFAIDQQPNESKEAILASMKERFDPACPDNCQVRLLLSVLLISAISISFDHPQVLMKLAKIYSDKAGKCPLQVQAFIISYCIALVSGAHIKVHLNLHA
jgi:hypothetical protein